LTSHKSIRGGWGRVWPDFEKGPLSRENGVEPDDRYLCIVPANAVRTRRVMLPFEGDEVLSVILSKALLLAADDTITDSAILHQLKRRA
jgi:hypothetical protein